MPWIWKDEETSAAFVPEQPQPEEREYVVTGEQPVLGHAKGEKFKATLSLEQEAQLLEGGHLEQVPPARAKKK